MRATSFFESVEKIKMIHRILIFVGIVLVLSAIFVFLAYIPMTGDIAQIRKEITGLEQKINRAKMRASNLGKFEEEETQVDAQFREALRLLPNKREIPNLLKSITQLGSDSNLEFRFFSPKKEVVADFYIEIPVSVEVSGCYHDVALFFDKVGRMERIVNILDVSMKPVKEGSTNLITTCDAVTYRFKGEADEKAEKRKGKKKKR
jgi:type IV pilus assembly protein PilO